MVVEDDEVRTFRVEVDESPAGRAVNDQVLAAAVADLDWHLDALRRSIAKVERPDRTWQTGVLVEAVAEMPRERLAYLLAVAMVRLVWEGEHG